jgi:2-polyprenyl-3-methyl-5-hydroxy-6-metoxy-1,4-benzoquinol methylase
MAQGPPIPARTNDPTALRERVESFEQWHYQFDLDGVRTPVFDRKHISRHAERRKYFFDPLVRLCGGDLSGKRVLDLGCNAGYWSLAAIEAGAAFVFGVDGRQMHVDQANLVFEVKRVESSRYRFELGDVFKLDLRGEEPFDIVLCLGLLYHVTKPFELMERISGWNSDILVIDTAVERTPLAMFQIKGEDVGSPRDSIDSSVGLRPSRRAVAQLARSHRYTSFAVLRPRFSTWEGGGDYQTGARRAFICSKQTELVGLDTEPVRDTDPLLTRVTRFPYRKKARRLRRRVRRFAGRARGRVRRFADRG